MLFLQIFCWKSYFNKIKSAVSEKIGENRDKDHCIAKREFWNCGHSKSHDT